MSDYLWDKTGAADPDVERLENLLGQLAHRPRQLELPAVAPRAARGSGWLRYAAAAAVLLAVLAGALVALRLARPTDAGHVAESTPAPAGAGESEARADAHAPRPEEAGTPEATPAPRPVREDGLAHRPRRAARRGAAASVARGHARGGTARRGDVARRGEVADEGRGRRAKEELIYALRLAGFRLEEVRRKVRGEAEGSGPAQ